MLDGKFIRLSQSELDFYIEIENLPNQLATKEIRRK